MKRFKIVNLAVIACCLGISPQISAQAYVYQTEAPVIAVGDIHGAYDELFQLLRGIELVDESGRWTGGNTHLVSVGDLVDRGPDSKSVMDLLMRLQQEAPASGGHVHVLLGNHELMNIGGDLRDVSEAEYAAMGGPEGHRQAFAAGGTYGRWLRDRPVAIKVNDTLFVHGGYSSLADKPLDQINADFWQATNAVLDLGRNLQAEGFLPADRSLVDPLNAEEVPEALQAWQEAASSRYLGRNSVVWYRGNVSCHPVIEAQGLEAVLSQHDAQRIVVGHTPTRSREVEARHQGKVVSIDTGMLASIYRGQPRALKIFQNELTALRPDGSGQAIKEVERFSDTESETIELRQRQAKREVAAYRLSSLLGLDFVLPTALVEGGVSRATERLMTERDRQERQLFRANNCETESDFDLLSAFDSLIGKRDRSADSLAYARVSWQIVALDNANAFDTSNKMPTYASPPKLNRTLRERLTALDEDSLNELLGDLLRTREISAILKRRDKILTWPLAS